MAVAAAPLVEGEAVNRALRRQHLTTMSVLALVVIALLAFGITARRHVPASEIPRALLRDRAP